MISSNGLMGLLKMGRLFIKTVLAEPDKIHLCSGKRGIESSQGKSNQDIYKTLNDFLLSL